MGELKSNVTEVVVYVDGDVKWSYYREDDGVDVVIDPD